MEIKSKFFGTTKDGQEVTQYTLINKHGHYMSVLNYGGIITEIMVPDHKGTLENVVLGFNNIADYEEKSPYFGCITGRIAGRISNSKFEIDGENYILAANNNSNNLHGGVKGFDKVIWSVTELVESDYVGLSLNYLSIDGEEGFPGNLDVHVTYKLTNDNELEIFYSATTDKKTIVNLTNHSYFNLSGNTKRDVLDQTLQFDASRFGCVDEQIIPAGISDVEGTPFDFRTAKTVGQDIKADNIQIKNAGGYDHPFLLDGQKEVAAILEDPESGRYMEVRTDQKAIVFYAGNMLEEGMSLSCGATSRQHLALCLETQYYPDAINQDCFETELLNPGETYKAYTKYSFKIR
ncbi:aldose epimerase family protein [Vallitalea okinawensis]|uniref:aldose epimerase family protein n=1 Tax=Vallitalea okinawensis TaxID=2078660 RepID=UPI000CFBA60A|nr:aldose epimerase family protein [Vallitalea okinawensis]